MVTFLDNFSNNTHGANDAGGTKIFLVQEAAGLNAFSSVRE